MADGNCSKRYPRGLVAEKITGNDGYHLYRRRLTADNRGSTIVKVNQQYNDIDNRWILRILQSYQRILRRTSILNLAILSNL